MICLMTSSSQRLTWRYRCLICIFHRLEGLICLCVCFTFSSVKVSNCYTMVPPFVNWLDLTSCKWCGSVERRLATKFILGIWQNVYRDWSGVWKKNKLAYFSKKNVSDQTGVRKVVLCEKFLCALVHCCILSLCYLVGQLIIRAGAWCRCPTPVSGEKTKDNNQLQFAM